MPKYPTLMAYPDHGHALLGHTFLATPQKIQKTLTITNGIAMNEQFFMLIK